MTIHAGIICFKTQVQFPCRLLPLTWWEISSLSKCFRLWCVWFPRKWRKRKESYFKTFHLLNVSVFFDITLLSSVKFKTFEKQIPNWVTVVDSQPVAPEYPHLWFSYLFSQEPNRKLSLETELMGPLKVCILLLSSSFVEIGGNVPSHACRTEITVPRLRLGTFRKILRKLRNWKVLHRQRVLKRKSSVNFRRLNRVEEGCVKAWTSMRSLKIRIKIDIVTHRLVMLRKVFCSLTQVKIKNSLCNIQT